MSETRTPQVGDLLILDRIARRITEIRGQRVFFDHPHPEEYAAASKRAWMARFLEEHPDWFIRHPGEKPYDPQHPPFELSCRGSTGNVSALRWEDGVNAWYLPGRLGVERPANIVIPDTPSSTVEGSEL